MKHIQDIKDKNKKNIIRLLYTKENLSKKRIAAELGLSPSGITKICGELIKEGIIIEAMPMKTEAVGRKEIQIQINPTYKYCFGVVINHKKTTIVLTDLGLNIIEKVSFSTLADPQKHINLLINSLNELMENNLLKNEQFIGIGISVKGITDAQYAYDGIWNTVVDLKTPIQKALGIKVALDNGVRCSALLEQLFSNEKNFIFFKYMEPGIGGALVRNGKIQRGETHSIVDFGHLIIDPDEEYCSICKRRGCLESIISVEQLLNYAKSNFSIDFCPVFWNLCEGLNSNITIKNIIEAVEQGSIIFNNVFQRNAKLLAMSIINTASIIDIKKIIIIGDLFSSKRFTTYFKGAINQLQLTPMYDRIQINTPSDAILSSVVLALNEFLFT